MFKTRFNSFSVMNGTKTDVLPLAAAISCSVGRPVVLIDAPPPKQNLLCWIIISPNATVKIKSDREIGGSHVSTPQCRRGQLFSAGIQNSLRAAFTLILHVDLQDQISLIVTDGKILDNPLHVLVERTRREQANTTKEIKPAEILAVDTAIFFVMNGEFSRFSSPVVCLHCRNLG